MFELQQGSFRAATSDLVQQINALGPAWHRAGTISDATMVALESQLMARLPIEHSIETGTGRTTLLFSHFSQRHEVFTKDDDPGDDSLAKVRGCSLFNPAATTFVLGRTQETVVGRDFGTVNVACIDGPHAYPFPDLEYWSIYPYLVPGSLLVIDDLQMPSIANMWEVLSADRMYEVVQVVDNTGFLQRTSAPTLDPFGEGWWEQAYNTRIRTKHLSGRDRAVAMAKAHVPVGLIPFVKPVVERLANRRA